MLLYQQSAFFSFPFFKVYKVIFFNSALPLQEKIHFKNIKTTKRYLSLGEHKRLKILPAPNIWTIEWHINTKCRVCTIWFAKEVAVSFQETE